MITLYSKDGQVKVEKIKKFSYSGKFMGECFITAPFAFSDILNFDIGDYVMFRDEQFVLNYIPAKKKQASKGSYGKAFEYDNVKFNSLADELTRIEFIDVVKYDNNITYSSQPTFSFYANSVHDLVDRIQANLDLEFKDDKKWTIVVSEDIVSPSKNISVSNISVADAVVLINTEFGLNFTFKNRTLTIGESGLAVGKVFAYGKDNGLFDIQQTTNQDAKIITRLRAFGSTRNIPRRYYNNLKDEQGKPYILESDDIKNLMLPSFPYEESDPRKLYLDSDNIEKYGVRYGSVYFDSEDNEIYPSIEGMTKEQLNLSNINVSLPKDDNGNLDEILGADNPSDDGLIPDEGKGKIDGEFKIYLKDLGFDLTEKDKDGQYKYQIAGQPVQIAMKSGMCVGREFDVVENGIKKDTSLGYTRYVLELKRFEDDNIKGGTAFPNSAYTISKGDKFVILGIEMPDVYVKSASQKLLVAAQEYLSQNDETKYSYQPTISSNFMARNPHLGESIKEGDIFTFKDDDLQIDASEIIQTLNIEYNLDSNPLPSYKVVLSNDKIASRLDKMQNSINTLVSNGTGITINQVKSLINTIGASMFLRKDISDSTDYLLKFLDGIEIGDKYAITKDGKAVLSAIESLSADIKDLVATKVKTTDLEAIEADLEKATINDLVAQLAKIHNLSVTDTANILRAVVGSISSDTFKSGFGGEGFRIYEALNGDWNLEIDNVIVRKVFSVFELIVQKITHQGGMVINSPNGAKITKVTDGGSYWKCEHDSATDFFKDDQILCQNFSGNNIKRYWRLATSTGKGYLNLSKTDQEANSASPQEGDEIVVLGNRTNINRQSAIIVSTIGDNAPYTAYYSNINSYSLVGKESTRTGNLNGIVDKDFGALKGNGLFSENVYLKGIFRLINGKTVETVLDENKQEANNKIESTKSELNASISKAEQTALLAQKSVDELEIVGVNLIPTPQWGIGGINADGTNVSVLNTNRTDYIPVQQGSNYVCRLFEGAGSGWGVNFYKERNDETISSKQVWSYKDTIQFSTNTETSYVRLNKLENDLSAKVKLEKGTKATDYSESPENYKYELKKEITSVRTDFQITEGQINGKLQETTQLLTESKTLSGETKQTLESTTARVNEFNITTKKFEGTLGEITKKQGEVEGSILAVQGTAKGLEASVNGFKETEKEIKDTATRIEATHQGIVLEASEKSAQKAIDSIEIGGVNLIPNSANPVFYNNGSEQIVNFSPIKKGVRMTLAKGAGANTFTSYFIKDKYTQAYIITCNIATYDCAITMYNGWVREDNGETYIPANSKIRAIFRGGFDSNNVRVLGFFARYDGTKIGDYLDLTDYMLELGNKPSLSWSPAPEDYDAKFTETHASLKVLNDQIASEVSKTNGIRTDLTTLSQSHNGFKAQVKSDISGAIDSNNEVIQSSFEMKDNVITMIGKEINVLAELKVGSNTLIKDGFINTDLLRVKSITADKIDVNSIFATRIQTGNLDVTAGATIGGFELGNGRIGTVATPGGETFGNLALYKDFFKIGGNHGYAMFGNDVIPASAGGAFSAVGRITNKKPNMSGDYGYDRANYGLFIDVEGGTKNYGLKSNAALLASAFINTSVGDMDLNGTTYAIDFSQHSIFIMNRSRDGGATVTMPSEDSVAQHFGMYSMPNGFGFIFTVVAAPGTNKITLLNIKDRNNNSDSFAFSEGDNATILVHKRRGVFEYQLLTYNT